MGREGEREIFIDSEVRENFGIGRLVIWYIRVNEFFLGLF